MISLSLEQCFFTKKMKLLFIKLFQTKKLFSSSQFHSLCLLYTSLPIQNFIANLSSQFLTDCQSEVLSLYQLLLFFNPSMSNLIACSCCKFSYIGRIRRQQIYKINQHHQKITMKEVSHLSIASYYSPYKSLF